MLAGVGRSHCASVTDGKRVLLAEPPNASVEPNIRTGRYVLGFTRKAHRTRARFSSTDLAWPAGEQDCRAHQPVTALGEESLKLSDRSVARHRHRPFAHQARRSRPAGSLSGGRIAPSAAGGAGLGGIKARDYVSHEHETLPGEDQFSGTRIYAAAR